MTPEEKQAAFEAMRREMAPPDVEVDMDVPKELLKKKLREGKRPPQSTFDALSGPKPAEGVRFMTDAEGYTLGQKLGWQLERLRDKFNSLMSEPFEWDKPKKD